MLTLSAADAAAAIGTPTDELEHLDSVLGRVSQLHVAEKKPKQVPDAGDVSRLKTKIIFRKISKYHHDPVSGCLDRLVCSSLL